MGGQFDHEMTSSLKRNVHVSKELCIHTDPGKLTEALNAI